MFKHLKQTIDESIQLELNISDLYTIFNQVFREDAYFWWTLSEEEERHAELIRKAGRIEILPDGIASEMLCPELQDIIDTNNKIVSFIDKYKLNPPSREEAFNVALEIEQSAGEMHFQEFMENSSDNILFQLFQKLNKDDKDHYARISSYMEEHGIQNLTDS
ncbi:rubrerythrin family protein [Candidatus Latescibacterota bacterium]